MRVKRGVKARKRRNSIFKLAKGFRGRSKNTIRQATQRVEKSLQYRYRDRKAKKRDYRGIWIVRIGAAAVANGLSYSQFMGGIKKSGVELDRKILADLGGSHPAAFTAVAEVAKSNLNA